MLLYVVKNVPVCAFCAHTGITALYNIKTEDLTAQNVSPPKKSNANTAEPELMQPLPKSSLPVNLKTSNKIGG